MSDQREQFKALLRRAREEFAASHPEIHRDPVLWMQMQRWSLMTIDRLLEAYGEVERLEQRVWQLECERMELLRTIDCDGRRIERHSAPSDPQDRR